MQVCDILNKIIFFLILSLVLQIVSTSEDYYELLGITRQATTRDIRKAFKKIAVVKHPDKNKDDPEAHNNFLKINRAYEVLKDEALRKKYDMHGEDGLKEDGPSGRGYQSWNFYQNDFGIYDDDAEIITLSRSDFESSVQNAEDVWFVNFYSPNCGHCHDLAPTWREMARELEGVIRIGAVNCMDDWHLCSTEGIQSYPSLLFYPERKKYYGEHTKKALVKQSLKEVKAEFHELWKGNFEKTIFNYRNPWLISFCGDLDCLTRENGLKVSAMLADLVHVGQIQCKDNVGLCKEYAADHQTYFFDKKVSKAEGKMISSLEAREIALTVLRMLPEITLVDESKLKSIKSGKVPWLLQFLQGENSDLELRKLPALLPEMNVGQVDCKVMTKFCSELHIHTFPRFIVFKENGGYEVHHGRLTAPDVAAFAREAIVTPVRCLGPADFPDVTESSETWFLDYFAPWCPPCMRLLPEFRKASREVADVHFGTIDCTVHQQLCNQQNVHSYPTTILYNNSKPLHFSGHHSLDQLLEFIEDCRNPPVIELTDNNFDELVSRRSAQEIWLIDFFAPWCGPCRQFAPQWKRLAKQVQDIGNVKVAQVDCQAHVTVCQINNIHSYPTIRMYLDSDIIDYESWQRDANSLQTWLFSKMPSNVVELTDGTFRSQVLASSDPWVVDFYTPWCGHCQMFAPHFQKLAVSLKGMVNAGKLNCEVYGHICQSADVHAYPTVRFYKGSRNSAQSYDGHDINSQDANYIRMEVLRRLEMGGERDVHHDEF